MVSEICKLRTYYYICNNLQLKENSWVAKTSNKKMLIILDQPGIGDTVCLLDALYNIERNFSEEFQIYFTAPKSVIHFLMSTNSTFGFEFISLDLVDKFKLNKFKSNSQILQVQNGMSLFHSIV